MIQKYIYLLAAILIMEIVPGRAICQTEHHRPTLGLVLSGGGAKGLAHIGVLKVFEEAGLKPDYIAGTSMGAIIGGLYAIGHNAKRLEKIVKKMNWDELLMDEIPRNSLSIEEKAEEGRYTGSFPIQGKTVGLPRGLVAGQNIFNFLSRLCWSVHHIDDFSQFPTPFIAVATDIVNGEPVLLDHGYLPDALRASMSLPSAFTPVDLDGHLLVDGGVVLNFPVSVLKEKNIDIIIGVDVGALLYKRDELTSMVRILDQTMSFLGVRSTLKQRELCDLLIRPDVQQYSLLDFSDTDSLIARGERAARVVLPELEELADSLNKYKTDKFQHIPNTKVDSIRISRINIKGLKNVSAGLLRGKLKLRAPCTIIPAELERAIYRAYGSNYFESVTYKFDPGPDGVIMTVRVIEKDTNYLKFGIRYDSNMKSAVLLNTTFRNIWGEGSKFLTDLKLGENPSIAVTYLKYTKLRLGIGFKVNAFIRQYVGYSYKNGASEASFNFRHKRIGMEFRTIYSNAFEAGIGAYQGVIEKYTKVAPVSYHNSRSRYVTGNLFIKSDTFNKAYYPQSGIQIYGEAKVFLDDPKIKDNELTYGVFKSYFLDFKSAIPLQQRLSLHFNFSGGILNGGSIPQSHRFHLGGQNTLETNYIEFAGRKFMEEVGKNMLTVSLGLQWEIMHNRYLRMKGNIGSVSDELNQLLYTDTFIYGGGTFFGFLSPVGPIDFALLWGNKRKGVQSYINIGFHF